MTTTLFYERRKESKSIDIQDRRTVQRRKQGNTISQEHRRLASQVRRYEREAFKIPVRLHIQDKAASGYTHDICPEGLLVFTETAVTPGIPLALKFSFGEHVCHLNISGQLVFCRLSEDDGSPQYAIGIKFSGVHDFEKNILASVVQELRQNATTQEKSLLTILVSKDILAIEAEDFFIQTSTTEVAPTNQPFQSTDVERRFSPRIAINLPLRLFPDDIRGHILDLGETGVCFHSEKPAPARDILISVDLSQSEPQQVIEIPARIVWNRASAGNTRYFGARFALVNDNLSKIREFVFNSYANKATALFKNSHEDLKIKIQDFFNKDIRQYHQDLSALALEIAHQNAEPEEIEKGITNLTDRILQKGDALEQTGRTGVYIKKVKEIFRELSGCWVYKSRIMKMAFEKLRGYPGDYKLFEIIYENKPLSGDIGFYFDKYFLNNTYTLAVRNRKDKMKSILKDMIKNNNTSCIRLLNVACGPCKEIRELFSESFEHERKIVFTGLDNDGEALAFSRSLLNNLPPNIEVRFLNENVLNLFKDEKYYNIIGKQDIIYILGLSEYLPDRIFKKLIHFLFQLLNHKGKLVITYKDKNIPFPAIPPDWLCDWPFVKRTEEDLINLAKGLGSGKYSLEIERENTGCIFFMILSKI